MNTIPLKIIKGEIKAYFKALMNIMDNELNEYIKSINDIILDIIRIRSDYINDDDYTNEYLSLLINHLKSILDMQEIKICMYKFN